MKLAGYLAIVTGAVVTVLGRHTIPGFICGVAVMAFGWVIAEMFDRLEER